MTRETDAVTLVRAMYDAYAEKGRAAIERLIGDDFHFTSPLDNRIDRATYFVRCWPNSESIGSFNIIQIVPDGERVFVTYEGSRGKGKFRNTEVVTVREGRIVEVEVYFGWSLPHAASPGAFVEDD
jgi:ketosteroid isomerase-like protein